MVKPVEDPAVEARLSRQTVDACVALRMVRGEKFRKPKSIHQPHHVLDELDLMLARGEISRPQYEAGREYGTLYRRSHERTYRCSLEFTERGGSGVSYEWVMVGRVAVLRRLHRVQREALASDKRLIGLCNAIFGDDWRIDASREARKAALEPITWALTRIAYWFGLLR